MFVTGWLEILPAVHKTTNEQGQTSSTGNMKKHPFYRLHQGSSRAALFTLAAAAVFANVAMADEPRLFNRKISGVPAANREVITDNVVSPEYDTALIAQGSDLLENPSDPIVRFGYLSDNSRTEPDENTYLVLEHNPGGPTAGYDYGRHFLFQGHENAGNRAYITRINLDVAHPDHRITLLTPADANGLTGFNSIDGSSWNPFSKTLVFSQEAGANGGIIEMSADFDPSTGAGKGLRTLYGSIGRGGYEGLHTDDRGNVYLVEDAGGTTVNFGKNPNSFVYRFVPTNPADLSQGKLQALQVWMNGSPMTVVPVDAAHPTGDILSANQLSLHTVGASWAIAWVTIHDTAADGSASFNANAAAKTAGATPFKRPENMAFQPGAHFETFFFCVTGDTDARSGNQPALAARGAWGGIFRIDLSHDRNTGAISLIALGDADHSSFDNLTFTDNKDTLLATEDRGDTLHDQLNKLDSVWAYNVKTGEAARLVALGADRMAPPATEEDNEPTGLHMSDGDVSITGLAGSKELTYPTGLLFFTQQHGENNLFQIFPRE